MTPEEAKAVANFLASNFEQEAATTVNVFNAAPSDRLDYRPDDTSMAALQLVRHITLSDEWLINCIADGEFANPPDDSDECGITTSSGAAEQYQAKVPAAIKRIREMSGEDLAKEIDIIHICRYTLSTHSETLL